MIEIRKLTSRDLDAIAEWHYDCLSKKIRKRLNSIELKKYRSVIIWLENNLEAIISARPRQLEKLSIAFDKLVRLERCRTYFNEIALPKIFDYNSFSKNKANAYALAKKLSVNVCPYCNRNYTINVAKVVGKRIFYIVRPDFDHFIPKSTCPLLALSFYNLIPCCSVCNSRIKGSQEMSLSKYIHPYLEGFDDSLRFTFKPIDVESMYGLSNNLEISVIATKTLKGSKSRRNVKLFKLKEIYNVGHTDEVADIVRKFHISGGKYLQVLARQFPQLGSVEELYKIAFSNYYNAFEFEKRPLSKLTKDIFEYLKFVLPI